MHPSYINYRLKSEVSITLRCQLCSTRYTVVRINNCSKSTSAIKVATVKKIQTISLSQAEAMLNSEKFKPVALANIELCLSEGISQSVSH